MKQRKLFTTALWISCKHSSRKLLCLLCVLLLCGGLLWVVLRELGLQDKAPNIRTQIAVINEDQNPMMQEILKTLGGAQEISELIELVFYKTREQAQDAKCIVTIPEGFLQSVFDGGNLSPMVEYDMSGVMESLWARQLAVAAADALSAAQRGVYATQEATDYGASIEQQQYQLLLAGVNMQLMRAFLVRDGVMEEQLLSASGTLSLPRYYLAAAVAAVFFAYAFLFYPAVDTLRRFAQKCRKGAVLFCVQWVHMLLLLLPVSVAVFCGIAGEISIAVACSALLFALLCTSFSSAICLAFSSQEGCAAGCTLLTAAMALGGGLLIPLVLMPRSFEIISAFLPISCAMQLVGVAAGGELPGIALVGQTLAFCIILLAISALLWRTWTGRGNGGQT